MARRSRKDAEKAGAAPDVQASARPDAAATVAGGEQGSGRTAAAEPDETAARGALEPDETAARGALELAAKLEAQGDLAGAMRLLLDPVGALGEGGSPELRDALAEAIVRLQEALASRVAGPEVLLWGELEFVRRLLALYKVRESAPGGRLATDTWGMAVSAGEFLGLVEPPDPPPELAALRQQVLERRAELDRLTAQAVMAGRFVVPSFALAERFGLEDLDLWLIMALAAAELDPAFDRAYRYAWQDYTKKQPDVGFLRDLLDRLPESPQAVLDRFAADAPLVRHHLVTLSTPPDRPQAGLAHRLVSLAPPVVEFLRGRAALDAALAGVATLRWEGQPLDALVLPPGVRAMLDRLYPPGSPVFPFRGALVGTRGAGKRTLAAALAWRDSRPLLALELYLAADDSTPARAAQLLALAVRDARLHRALLYVDLRRAVAGSEGESGLLRVLSRELAGTSDLPVVLGARGVAESLFAELPDLCEVALNGYGTEELLELWSRSIAAHGLPVPERELLLRCACQPGLTPGMVESAAAEIAARAQGSGRTAPREEDLRQVVRNQMALGLAGVAQRVRVTMDWSDLVLPERTLEQLRDIVVHLRFADQVFDGWGFSTRFPYGKGLPVLFSGPPGTGKTMAAGIIARELGIDLFQVDLSQIVSKWIGETEKTLARIFDEAERVRAGILFDEADSLFGRRTEQKSSTDRYANLETNYLLQRIESYQGLVILTTNFEENIDEAFRRRLRFSIHFPFPEVEARRRIWRVLIPAQAALKRGIDWDLLAEDFELAGGNIKNAVLRAAFAAAKAGDRISQDHLTQAAVEEYRALGKLVRD